jgi:uncharacterized protein (TIGR02996 family)
MLREAKDRPGDDAPRMLLADWLEKRGDPRGEFVRLQVARARMPSRDPRRAPIELREQELLDGHSERWFGPLRTRRDHCRFERGLLRIAVHTPRFFASHSGEADSSESFAWVEALMSFAALTPAHVDAIAASPLLPHLGEFHLNATRLGPRGAARLAALPALARLTALYLWWGSIGPDGAAALARSPHLAALRTLHLSGHNIGLQGAAAIANSPHLTRLTMLRLSHNDLGPAGAEVLADSPRLASLAELHLNENRIGMHGARALADSPHLARLSALYLIDDTIGVVGAAALRARFGRRVHLSIGNRRPPTEADDPRVWWKQRQVLAPL